MRAVSLSNNQVVSLLNSCFVPVFTSNEDFAVNGAAPDPEKALMRRIHQDGYAAKLSVGTVHAYVISPDGKPVASLHTAEAAKPGRMIEMLETSVKHLGTPAGQPLIVPAKPEVPQPDPGDLLVHVTARHLERRGQEYALVTNAGGNWSALPGEDWVRLDRGMCVKLLPPSSLSAGQSWEVDQQVAEAILTRFYPPTENNDLSKNRFERLRLTGTLRDAGSKEQAAGSKEQRTAWLEGAFKLKHPFYHKDDANVASGTVSGYLTYTPARPGNLTLRLVTVDATYGPPDQPQPFGAVARSAP